MQRLLPNVFKGPITVKPKMGFTVHDKEHLYDEAVKLKQSMNIYRDENMKLKTRVALCDKELEKKDKIIQELLTQLSTQGQGSAPSLPKGQSATHLVIALKKQLKESKDEIRAKEEEIKKLKKSLKITRLQETEVEIKMFADECTRLKHIIEEIMKQKAAGYTPEDVALIEEKINQQDSMIHSIKQQNNEMSEVLKKKDEEIANWKDVTSKLQKRLGRMENEAKENTKTRKNMADTKKELQKLKDQLSTLKANNKDKEAAAHRSRIEELLRKQNELNDRLEQKDKKVKLLEQKLNEGPQKENEKEQELGKLRRKAKELENELNDLKKQSQIQNMPEGILPIVDINEIKGICEEIKISLMISQISPDSIKDKLFEDFDENISIHELSRIFKRNPIKSKHDTLKLARYLIEPRAKNEVKINEKLEEKIDTVIERLKSLLGDFSILTLELESELKKSISEVIYLF